MGSTEQRAGRQGMARFETEVLPPSEASQLPKSYRVGAYEIRGIIGKGGIGVVYRARAVERGLVPVGTQVALKMLADRQFDEQDRRRFEREASYLQALRHPGIVRIYDLDQHRGRPYLVMELVQGQTLDQLLDARGPLDGSTVADLLLQACEALHVAHLAGILHRDLKPGNIMLTRRGGVKVLDFGMAQRLDAESKLTATGSVLGTPAYMSPEQAGGAREHFTPRSDIYSLGAVMYELVTGRQPFSADNSMAMLRRILEDELEPPSRFARDLPRDLETVILTAMAKDGRDRYATAEAMAADLRRWRTGQRIRARRIHPLRRLLRQLHHHRRSVALIALMVFSMGVGATLVVRESMRRAAAARLQLEDEVKDRLDEMVQGQWLPVWEHAGTFDPESRPGVQDHPLVDGLRLAPLPPVDGDVRLSLQIAPRGGPAGLELLICDRDIGQGYALRLLDQGGRRQLTLLRGRAGGRPGDRTVVARRIIAADGPLRLSLARDRDLITVAVDEQELIRFVDLAPIEGSEADGVFIALRPGSADLGNLLLERKRPPERVSRLVAADVVRQDGRYARALAMYREFLRDFPDSVEARDARYRVGLCQAALQNYEEALATFLTVRAESLGDPRWYIAATFQAWDCALRLGRHEEAEVYFDGLRTREFELEAILAAVPEDTLRGLPRTYIERAHEVADHDPTRAALLATTGARIAEYLNERDLIPVGLLLAADLELAAGDPIASATLARRVSQDGELPELHRIEAQLRLGRAERLRRNQGAAVLAWQALMARYEQHPELAQWGRLWLGDLLLSMGDRRQAIDLWQASPEHRSLPGRIMRHLLTGTRALVLRDSDGHDNELAYFNAVLSFLNGERDSYREQLQDLIRRTGNQGWPGGLAQLLLENLERETHWGR